jgi:hypothetical protein
MSKHKIKNKNQSSINMQAHASRLLVSVDAPHLIWAAETSLQSLLGHAPHELVGKDIRILQGPETDTGLLSFALDQAAVMQSQIILHERHGLTTLVDVSCEPHFSTSQNKRCVLMGLTASETITLGQALGEATLPCALLAAEWPHRVRTVNQLYSEAFGVAAQDVVSKSANHIKPAELTDSGWQALLDARFIQGRQAVQTEVRCRSPCGSGRFDLHFVPVVSAPNRSVEHILVRFASRLQPPRASFAEYLLDAPQYTAAATPVAARVRPWLASVDARPCREGVPQDEITANFAPLVSAGARPDQQAATPLIIDEGYLRRLRRRHQAAARRATTRRVAPEAREGVGSLAPRHSKPPPFSCTPPAGVSRRDLPLSPLSSFEELSETASSSPSPSSSCPPRPELAPAPRCVGVGGGMAEGGEEGGGGWGWLDGEALPPPAWLESA